MTADDLESNVKQLQHNLKEIQELQFKIEKDTKYANICAWISISSALLAVVLGIYVLVH